MRMLLRVLGGFGGALLSLLAAGLAYDAYLLYRMAADSIFPPPLWKSIAVVVMLATAVSASGVAAYRLFRFTAARGPEQ
jgi:hypothetical protein